MKEKERRLKRRVSSIFEEIYSGDSVSATPEAEKSSEEKQLKKDISSIFEEPSGERLIPGPPPVETIQRVEPVVKEVKKAEPKKRVRRKKTRGSILGIDIGISKVAVVEMRDGSIVNFGLREIEGDLTPEEKNKVVKQTIQDLVNTYKVRTKKVSAVVSSSAFFK